MSVQKTKLKILLYVEEFLPLTETFIYNQLLQLSQKHEVRVVCLKKSNDVIFPYSNLMTVPPENGWIEKISGYLKSRLIFLKFRHNNLASTFRSALDTFDPDVIFTHFGLNALTLWKSLPEKHPDVFYFFHGYDASLLLKKSSLYRRRLNELMQNKAFHPLYVCQALKANVKKQLRNSTKGRILHMGIDVSYFKRKELFPSQSNIVIIQVASFMEKKGQDLTIQAFSNWGNKNAELIFIGDGPKKKECEELSKKLGISTQTKFAGHLEIEKVKDYLEKSHLFIHPSRTSHQGDKEGIPTSIMEAMAMHLPVISTHHSGIPELIEHRKNGFLTAEGDINGLTKYIEMALEMGETSINRKKIEEYFNLEKQTEELERIFFDSKGFIAL